MCCAWSAIGVCDGEKAAKRRREVGWGIGVLSRHSFLGWEGG